MVKESTWDLLKEYYRKTYGIDPSVIDYIAVYDILKLCASGYSVSSIANRVDDDGNYVVDVLKEFFNFGGFAVDLDFDVQALFSRHKYNKYVFCNRAHELDKQATPETVNTLYRINSIFMNMEREIENYYAKA